MSDDSYLTKQVLQNIRDKQRNNMYEKEELKIKQDIYDIQTKYQDKHIITEEILRYIKNNINIIWDVIRDNK